MTTPSLTFELSTMEMPVSLFDNSDAIVTISDPEIIDVDTELVVEDGVIKIAAISRCQSYRYILMRVWDLSKPLRVYIMLNPSTATARLDDPTIRRCMGFAKRDGYGGIIVVNLFAFRSKSPEIMKAAEDPVGPMNARFLQHVFEYATTAQADVIAAWGVHGEFKDQDYGAVQQAEITGTEVRCFGKTKAGHPKHPLYLPGDAAVQPLRSDQGEDREARSAA